MAKESKTWESVNLCIHDTETTGLHELDRETGQVKWAEIIESAQARVTGGGELLVYSEELCEPSIPISPMASVTHGYRMADVKGKPRFEEGPAAKLLREWEAAGDYYVAHNAPFDIGMLEVHGLKWSPDRVIDTLSVAKHLFPEEERHSLQYFRYAWDMDDMPIFREKMEAMGLEEVRPHTALSDIFVLWVFLDLIREKFPDLGPDDLVFLSQKPAEERIVSFGSFYDQGLTYDEVVGLTYEQYGRTKKGYDYLDWAAMNMENLSASREFSVKAALARGSLNGVIPKSSMAYKRYLVWGAISYFEGEQLEKAFTLLGATTKAAKQRIFKRYREAALLSIREEIRKAEAEGKLDRAQGKKFLLNWLEKHRTPGKVLG